jgi:hypothetical protein
MEYKINEDKATKYGLDESVLLNILDIIFRECYDIKVVKKNKKEVTWKRISTNELSQVIPFWTQRQIRTLLSSLLKQGAIKSKKFNKCLDRRLWYAILT